MCKYDPVKCKNCSNVEIDYGANSMDDRPEAYCGLDDDQECILEANNDRKTRSD